MAAVEVGVGYVSVVPSARGFAAALQQQIGRPTVQVGAQLGEQSGQAAGRGMLKSLGGIVKGGIAAVAVTGAALFTAAFGQAVEQNKSNTKLAAQLGLNSKDSARAGQIAGSVYAKGYGESIDQVNDALRTLAQNGVVALNAPRREVEGLSKSALGLAEAFDVEVGDSAKAAGQLIRTGLVKDAKGAFDLITAGFQRGADKSGDFLDTLNEYSTQWRDLGLSGSQAVGLITQGLRAGARDADIVADALKEFAIRAKDGSKTTAQGFQTLGLSADKMAQTFAKGGPGAAAALDTLLDRLRAIPDPVKRSQTAILLFGTQAEDLQQSLFALDPSSATQALGSVGGAADRMGKTLHGSATAQFEVFKRQVLQGLVGFINRDVLPAVVAFGGFLITYVLPPLRQAGAAFETWLLPALVGVTAAFAAGIGWVREYGVWLIPLGIAIGGVVAVTAAQTIATWAVIGVLGVYSVVSRGIMAVTRAWAIVQAGLNAVMSANPIGLVVVGLLALGAALVVAYNKSATFRAIVQAAWAGIQAAALWAWNNALKPLIGWLVTGWQAIAAGAMWLWSNVLSPVFGFINTAARIVATIVGVVLYVAFKVWWAGVQLYLGLVMAAVRAVAAVFSWLWSNIVSPVIGWIVAGFRLWWTGAQLYFGLVAAGLRMVGGWAAWLWRNAISPVVGWVVAGFRLMWAGVQVIFGLFMAGLRTVGGWATWLWRNAVAPAINGVRSVLSSVYQGGIKPVLDTFRSAIGQVGKAFDVARAAIKIAWDKIKGIAKAPVDFVINTVYNRGIVGVWNKVASAFGAPQLKPFKFARGGPVFGAGTETSDDVPAWLSNNEHVWTAKEVKGIGGHGAVMALRKWAAAGANGPVPGFKDGGGLFGWIGKGASKLAGWGSAAWDKVKAGAKWLKDTIAASARAGVTNVVEPLLKRIPGANTGFGKMISSLPRRAIDAMFGYADNADKKGASSTFGGGKIPSGQHLAIINAALRAAGVPPPGTLAQWQAGLNTLVTRESGWNASAINRWDSNARAGHPSQGLAQTIPSTFNAFVPPALRSRGILDPVANLAAAARYIVATYGNITRVQQADASKSPKGYDVGGWMGPGDVGVNHLRRPEAVLTPAQSTAFVQLAAAAAAAPASVLPMAAAAGAGRRELTVPVYYNAPMPEDPQKAALEIGRRVQRAVTV